MNARLELEGVVVRSGKGRRRDQPAELVTSPVTELLFNAYFNGKMIATAPPAHLLAAAAAASAPVPAPAPVVAAITAGPPPSPPTADMQETAEQQVPMAISDTVARLSLDERAAAAAAVSPPSSTRRGTVRAPSFDPVTDRRRHGFTLPLTLPFALLILPPHPAPAPHPSPCPLTLALSPGIIFSEAAADPGGSRVSARGGHRGGCAPHGVGPASQGQRRRRAPAPVARSLYREACEHHTSISSVQDAPGPVLYMRPRVWRSAPLTA